jgi:transcription initiation factor TFIIE subunit alpha
MGSMAVIVDIDALKKVAEVIAGANAIPIVMAIKEAGEATDEEILMALTDAGETTDGEIIMALKEAGEATDEAPKFKLNAVRKILFKLHNHSIVQCNVGRDEETGWFIFRWKLQPDQIEGYVKTQKMKILRLLKSRLEHETNNEFYYCFTPSCDRFTFEDAMEFVFRCPTCNKTLQHYDNRALIDVLTAKIATLEKKDV